MSSHDLPVELPFPLMGIPVAAIVGEAERRSWIEPQVLAVLTLAIDENWTAIPTGFFDQLAALPHPSIDPWYQLAQLRRAAPTDWQAFKSLLYRHIRAAQDLYEGTEEDPLSALTPDEQRELFDNVKAIRDQLGPTLPGWPSLGVNAKGQQLTWRDAFGVVKADIAAIRNKLLGP